MPFLKIKRNSAKGLHNIAEERVIRAGFRPGVYERGVEPEKYTGEFKYDKRHGKGVQAFGNGIIYEGDWVNGKRNGHGVLSRTICGHERQRIYSGLWKNNKPTGFGLKVYDDGGVYEGEFQNGLRHGVGSMYYENGDIYLGRWFNDQRQGIGRLVNAATGNFYEGEFMKDLKCGRGRYFHLAVGQIQEGVWFQDQAQVSVLRDDERRRAFASHRTLYPIPPLGLKHPEEMYNERALEVLECVKVS